MCTSQRESAALSPLIFHYTVMLVTGHVLKATCLKCITPFIPCTQTPAKCEGPFLTFPDEKAQPPLSPFAHRINIYGAPAVILPVVSSRVNIQTPETQLPHLIFFPYPKYLSCYHFIKQMPPKQSRSDFMN